MATTIDELPEGLPSDESNVSYLKQPPHSVAMEQSLLGCVMLCPELLQTLSITADDFYRRDHRLIWQLITDMRDADCAVDPVSIMEWAERKGIDGLGNYALDIANATFTPANAESYAAAVLDDSLRRQQIDAGMQAAQVAYDKSTPLVESSATATHTFVDINQRAEPVNSTTNDPVDLFGVMTPPEVNPAWLPDEIASYAFEKASSMGSSPSAIAVACLVACASVTHDGVQIQPKRNEPTYRESARLWGLIVGDPSVRKTAMIKAGIRHLSAMDRADAEANKQKNAEYDMDLKRYKKAEAAYLKADLAGSYSGDVPKPPERPKRYRNVLQDATIEAMADILADNEGGILYHKDEMAGWFGAMDAYRSKGGAGSMDRAKWLEAYEGGGMTVDRVSRGTLVVPNWSACLIGGVQPDKIAAMADQMDDDGLLQRFMPVIVRSASTAFHDTESDPRITATYHDILEELRNRGGSINPVKYSPDAYNIYVSLTEFAAGLASSTILPAMLRSHLGKWMGLFSRLCLTYHAIGCASHHCNVSERPISKLTAQKVDQFMRRFLLPHAATFYCDTLAKTPSDKALHNVASVILTREWRMASKRDLGRYCLTFKRLSDYQQKRVIQQLIDAGWLIQAQMMERDPKSWRVNPKVHVMFKAQAATESLNRSENAAAWATIRSTFRPGENDPE